MRVEFVREASEKGLPRSRGVVNSRRRASWRGSQEGYAPGSPAEIALEALARQNAGL